MRFQNCLLILLSCLFCASNALAELSNQLNVGGQSLVLNGSGGRTKAFIQIYESGLYLMTPSRDSKTIIAADELMAIRIKITSGFVSRSSLVSSLKESLESSSGGNMAAIAKETNMFIDSLKEEVKKDDTYDFVHVPNKGLLILKNGSVKGTVPGLAFKKALFGVWLSDAPVDKDLRQAMLSGGLRR